MSSKEYLEAAELPYKRDLRIALYDVPFDIYAWTAAVITVLLCGPLFIVGIVLLVLRQGYQPDFNIGIGLVSGGGVVLILCGIIFGGLGFLLYYVRSQESAVVAKQEDEHDE
eukprot:gene2797-4205_t